MVTGTKDAVATLFKSNNNIMSVADEGQQCDQLDYGKIEMLIVNSGPGHENNQMWGKICFNLSMDTALLF